MKHTCNRCLAVMTTLDGAPLPAFCRSCVTDKEIHQASDNLHKFRRRHFTALRKKGRGEFVARFETLMLSQAPYWQDRR